MYDFKDLMESLAVTNMKFGAVGFLVLSVLLMVFYSFVFLFERLRRCRDEGD